MEIVKEREKMKKNGSIVVESVWLLKSGIGMAKVISGTSHWSVWTGGGVSV